MASLRALFVREKGACSREEEKKKDAGVSEI